MSSVIAGILFIIIGTILLAWNEKNNVNNIKTVAEIEKTAIEIKSDTINSSNEGKLIVTNGKVNVNDEIVVDKEFNIGDKTIKLSRYVEVYQWEEEEHDGKYTYEKKWSEDLINSENFDDTTKVNPTIKPYESLSFTADSVNLGVFELSDEQKDNSKTDQALSLSGSEYLPSGYHEQDNYITNSVDEPQIGDVRISFYVNDWSNASVLAVQTGNSFTSFVSKVGKTVNRIEGGIKTKAEIINHIKHENKITKWLLRLLGNLASGAVKSVAFLMGLIHSLIIIIISWFVVRPILSICLTILTVVLVIILINVLHKNKKSEMMNQVTVQPNNNQVTNEQAQNSSNIINNNESIEPSNNTVQEINMTSISQNESSIEQTANNQINTTTDNKNDNNQVF